MFSTVVKCVMRNMSTLRSTMCQQCLPQNGSESAAQHTVKYLKCVQRIDVQVTGQFADMPTHGQVNSQTGQVAD